MTHRDQDKRQHRYSSPQKGRKIQILPYVLSAARCSGVKGASFAPPAGNEEAEDAVLLLDGIDPGGTTTTGRAGR